jgi:hypothetical protein
VSTKDVVEEFGYCAGRVWKELNTHGPLNEKDLLKNTRLQKNNLYAAIGWLARENKIQFENNLYILGETNLTDNIGNIAGKIWETLEKHKEIDISSISRLAKINETNVYHALGWLAREDKIQVKKGLLNTMYYKIQIKKSPILLD